MKRHWMVGDYICLMNSALFQISVIHRFGTNSKNYHMVTVKNIASDVSYNWDYEFLNNVAITYLTKEEAFQKILEL